MESRVRAIAGGVRAQRIDSRIDLDSLPVRRVESGHKVAGVIIGLVGGIMVLAPLGILYGELTLWGLLSPFVWVGTVILLAGVHLAIMGKEVTLHPERVAVRTRGVLGRKAWEEPLAAYRGVLLRSQWVTGGQHQHSHQVFLVELQHEDPKKSVAIFESHREKGWHATWRAASLRFRLAAMEETPDGVMTQSPEALEQSVREKVQAGSLDIAFDPSAPSPAELAVRAVDGGLDIRVLPRNWRSPGLWSGVGAIVVVGVFLGVMGAWGMPGGVLAVGAGVCLAATAAWFGVFLASQARLQVGRASVTASLMTPLGELRRQVVDAAQIHGVRIGAAKGQQGGSALHLLTDEGRIYFGAGLSRPALEWLCNCLLAAVARL